MGVSMIPILLYSDAVPANARAALKAVADAPPSERTSLRVEAAHVLYRETELECDEVRDLVGLPADGTCT